MKPDKQTWDLLIGALKGSLDAAEKFRFETWIAETENRRFYDNLTRVWREIQQRAADYEPDRDKLWQQLRQRIGTPENPRSTPWGYRRGTSLLRMAAAAAATVVVTLLVARPDLFRSAAAPAEQQLCAFEGKSHARLADGSTVWLHSGSTLTYDTRFNDKDRSVKLCGEGFFDIAKDPERPFTVEVEGLKVRVHGTKFNVRDFNDEGMASTTTTATAAIGGSTPERSPGTTPPPAESTSGTATWRWNRAGPRGNSRSRSSR